MGCSMAYFMSASESRLRRAPIAPVSLGSQPPNMTLRASSYAVVAVGLTVGFLLGHGSGWRGSAELHTLMEAVATLLALLIGAMALVRYYSKKSNTFLFIGAGFLGTAFLDGYHAVVTSAFFRPFMPSDLPSLIPWSWVASRQFLAVFMLLSWLAWLRQVRLGDAGRISEGTVYAFSVVFTLASFLFFAFAPLPAAYYPEIFFHRPEEFAPALFFLLALIGYLRKGAWKSDPFEHWLVLSLVVGLVGQTVFMSHSGTLFDYEFDIAHSLKKASYVCVLSGLLISMYATFRREEESAERVRAIVDTLVDGVVVINERGLILSANPATEQIFGHAVDDLIGRNVSIIAAAPYAAEHDQYIKNYLTTGQARIIGLRREVEGRHRDGNTVPLELAVAEMRLPGERLFVGILRDISERRRVDRLKNEFVSTVSHELRTPLTSISGSLGLLAGGVGGEMSEQANNLIDIARNNSERLVRLINDILDVEKIESGRMVFNMEPLDLLPLIEESLSDNAGYGAQFGVDFQLAQEAVAGKVIGDRDRLTQVVTNLLSNAAKFSPEGGTVRVFVDRQDHLLRISVADSGPGIPEEDRGRIFERFVQADSTDSRSRGGTGLGLSICKAIAERHNGVIDFETTTGDGSGTTFHLRLPEWHAGKATLSPARGPLPRILICEDDADTAFMLQGILEGGGLAADIARDAEAAKRLLGERDYLAMTLDIALPGQSGIELIRELRQEASTRELPIVVVSGHIGRSREDLGGQEFNGDALSVVDWLSKPVDGERLVAAVQTALRRRQSDVRPCILHVEDDADVCRVVATLLEQTAEVVAAASVDEARRRLTERTYDLLVLDLSLPDGSGLTLLPDLRRRMPLVPVLVFSAHESGEEVAREVAEVLVKSRTSNDQLLAAIKALIGSE